MGRIRNKTPEFMGLMDRVVGAKLEDTPGQKAEKAIAVMKSAGMPTRKAQAMLDAYYARGGK